MNTPDTVYRGELTADGFSVTRDGRPFRVGPSLHFARHADGFAWGYRGAGPQQLAFALLLDVTGEPAVARRWAHELMLHCSWLLPSWSLTAADIRGVVAYHVEHERRWAPHVRRCRACGCTDEDCSQCVAAMGEPCCWVAGEPDLCSRCALELDQVHVRPAEGGGS